MRKELLKGLTEEQIKKVHECKNADEILVLEDGKIAEQGTHSELIEEGGIYARMYRIQSEA